jgi:phosphoglycerate dehydrogenase-like enzyme
MRKPKIRPSEPFHVHMEVSPKLTPILSNSLTPDQFRAGAARFPGSDDGLEVTFGSDPDSLGDHLATCEVLVMAGPADLSAVVKKAPRLRWVHYTGTGIEGILSGQLRPGVIVTNARGVQTPKALEYSLAAVLMLNNRFPEFFTNQRESRWRNCASTAVAGKSIVILGMGALGAAAGTMMKQFGLRVIGVSRSGRPHPSADRVCGPGDLAAVLPTADFVLVTLPLTAETRGMIGRAELDLLPRHAGVINIGRGPVIDYDALMDKLRKGELGGAILDVFYEEPLPANSPLWSTPNLIVTPHSSLMDPVNYGPRCFDIFFDNLRRYRKGQDLRNVIDVTRGY